jgi:hypothetical protein
MRPAPFPYPFDREPSNNQFYNYYFETEETQEDTFVVSNAMAEYNCSDNYFTVKKVPADAEIKIDYLPPAAKKLFIGKGGSREKEWGNMVAQEKKNGGHAVRIHRGAKAKELRAKYADRLIPSRWLDKWKDMGDDYEIPLTPKERAEANVATHLGAKSRWILQGFHDPDIAILNRSVPTPETSDVPLCLQMLASILAEAWIGDIKGAFSQGLRGQRSQPLFALPPPGGIPGESDDILIEILAEIYGLISGPPGWRRSLFTTLKQAGFKAHPLAPCVVIMYEDLKGVKEQFSGLVCVETDDLLGGGIGPKYDKAVKFLREEYTFGKWKILKQGTTEYGGRTVWQLPDSSFKVSMSRYLSLPQGQG